MRLLLCLCLLPVRVCGIGLPPRQGLPVDGEGDEHHAEGLNWRSNSTRLIQRRVQPRIASQQQRPSTLIVLTYYDPIDNEEEESWRRENLVFFFKKAILPRPEYHYVIVFQGCHQIEVPDLPNVEVLERDNTCFDAGGWLDVLILMRKRNERFKHYIFLNGSVRGPFMPAWALKANWVAAFTRPFVEDPSIKLVGTTANCWFIKRGQPLSEHFHLQSMVLATDYEGLEMCLQPVMEEPPCLPTWTKQDVIDNRELNFTRCFLDRGYSVRSLSLAWQGVNISESNRDAVVDRCLQLNPKLDMHYWDQYFKDHYGDHRISYTPLELMFFKTNRDIVQNYLDQYTTWAVPELANLEEALKPYLRAEPRGKGCRSRT